MLDPEEQKAYTQNGRQFMKAWRYYSDEVYKAYESDQNLKRPQPPLVKGPMRPGQAPIDLPRDFERLNMPKDAFTLMRQRKSSRYYSQGGISLLNLSFLLWASQGIRDIRGNLTLPYARYPRGRPARV